MHILRLDPAALLRMTVQPDQDVTGLTLEYAIELAKGGPSHMAIEGGRVLAAAGLLDIGGGCAWAWAILSNDLRRHMVPLHRAVARFITACEFRRVEMRVAMGHRAGHRWAMLLGFEPEGVLRAAMPKGSDAMLYARVR